MAQLNNRARADLIHAELVKSGSPLSELLRGILLAHAGERTEAIATLKAVVQFPAPGPQELHRAYTRTLQGL